MYGFSVIESLLERCSSFSSGGRPDMAGLKASLPCGKGPPNFRCIWPARSPRSVASKKLSSAPSAPRLPAAAPAVNKFANPPLELMALPLAAAAAAPPARLKVSRRSTEKSMGKPSSCAAKKRSKNSSKTDTRWPFISTIWSPINQPYSSAWGLQKPTTEVPWRRRPSVPSSSSFCTRTRRSRKQAGAEAEVPLCPSTASAAAAAAAAAAPSAQASDGSKPPPAGDAWGGAV
mmetsp:Transcript_59998/g.152140  ORF Transcript_59998/g.152140 Transcript_59998/m.152140 type:complete len:232 (+) Transcript_59998:691-1386(+)